MGHYSPSAVISSKISLSELPLFLRLPPALESGFVSANSVCTSSLGKRGTGRKANLGRVIVGVRHHLVLQHPTFLLGEALS